MRKDVNEHIPKKYPNFKYHCRYCSKSYVNYASKYKHENLHGVLKHICNVCHKAFQFKKNLTVHKRRHTGVGLYICPKCPQFYMTKHTMDYHLNMHHNRKFTCTVCSFSTDTNSNLRQHHLEQHRQGWLAPRGMKFQWPPKLFRHKKKCSTSLKLKEKKEGQLAAMIRK